MKSDEKFSLMRRPFVQAKDFFLVLKKERILRFLGATCAIILLGATSLFIADRYYATKGAAGILDAIYWAVVTIATVGYGDVVPNSPVAKVLALVIILSGPALLSLLTASVASMLVEKKIREGQGLETIKDRDHVIICGWNENGDKVVDGILLQLKGTKSKIVLVNELDKEDIQSIQYQYKDYDIAFVRGNFVKEEVLARANLPRARAAIVLADLSGGRTVDKADERTIFGTMTIKSMASKVRTCAELIHGENREHLLRANVDEIIARGESTGALLATAAISPGLADSIKVLLNNQDPNKLWRVPVPSRFEDKTFGELLPYFRDKFQALLVGVVREKESIQLEDILSGDSTFIDDFIRKKFEESGKDYFGDKKDVSVLVNPPDDYLLSSKDWVIAIAKEKPIEAGFVERLVGGVP
ncbi:MAG: Ion transport 2 domain protein [Deltaproteobacteria bacterium]|nr:Ion transport 2 domain protein [Deltaproteobacteria bacterium]